MSIAVNSVLRYGTVEGGAAERLAVLWIGGDGNGWAIDLADEKSQPRPFERREVESDLDEGACMFEVPNASRSRRKPSEAEVAIRDGRWAAIRDAVADEPRVYDAVERSALFRSVAEKGGFTLNTARKLFQLYWRGGKTAEALLPDFDRRGGAGRLREPGDAKLGRPRGTGRKLIGLNLNREQKRSVTVFARAQIRRDGKRMLTTCYKLWLDRHFYEDGVDNKGASVRVPRSEYAKTGVPTLDQFKRVYYSQVDVIEAKRVRDPRRFALNYRPLMGTATSETWGPGSRYLIDATMADIYLVSRDNRSRIVGRPVVYVVIDVWSRLIVGLYVAIEDASWTSAMMALANAACSKVAFCAEHGIEIAEDEWPAGNIGARLLSDHGEVDSKVAGNLALHFNRVIEAAAAYRGDLKGLVETQFNTLQVQFGQFTPGYVASDYGTRGARDYRLDAVLDVNQFTATMIDLVLARNSATLKSYDRDQGMPADLVKLAPIELFHWGLQHRSGRMQAWPEERVRFRLMPTAEVSVDRNGISFQGRSYVGPSVRRMMSQARMGRHPRVTISFDPRTTDAVYLHDDDAPHGFEVCEIHDASRAYAGRTCVEADQDRQLMTAARRDAETRDVTRDINVAKRMQERVAEARAAKPSDAHVPKTHKTRGIRENRAEEKARTKIEQGEAFRPAKAPPSPVGRVVPSLSPLGAISRRAASPTSWENDMDETTVPWSARKGGNVGIPEFDGNPFISALPPPPSDEDCFTHLLSLPCCTEAERLLPAHLREYLAFVRIKQSFIPTGVQVRQARQMDLLIRSGYVARNPTQAGYQALLTDLGTGGSAAAAETVSAHRRTSALAADSMAALGPSGIGKTTVLRRMLDGYEQVVRHNSAETGTVTQIVWLRVETASDGSPKQTILSMFAEIDRLLGSTYVERFGKLTREQLIIKAQQICARYAVGLIAVDEIQNLANSPAGRDDLMSFLTSLVNVINVPILMIGTMKAVPMMMDCFRTARRGEGVGSIVYEPMPMGEEWRTFVRTLFRFQWTTERTEPTPEIEAALWDRSQGIIDIAVKLFVLSQLRAIRLGARGKPEVITVPLMDTVARESLKLVEPMLDALRRKDWKAVAAYDDLVTLDRHLADELQRRWNCAAGAPDLNALAASLTPKVDGTASEVADGVLAAALVANGIDEGSMAEIMRLVAAAKATPEPVAEVEREAVRANRRPRGRSRKPSPPSGPKDVRGHATTADPAASLEAAGLMDAA